MARRVFFSFKYLDVSRAMVVRNSWVTQGREAAGFIDAAEFEKIKRQGDAAIQRWVSQNGPNPALPPVPTVDAAMQVAMGDYPLTPDEAQALRALLLVEPT